MFLDCAEESATMEMLLWGRGEFNAEDAEVAEKCGTSGNGNGAGAGWDEIMGDDCTKAAWRKEKYIEWGAMCEFGGNFASCCGAVRMGGREASDRIARHIHHELFLQRRMNRTLFADPEEGSIADKRIAKRAER